MPAATDPEATALPLQVAHQRRSGPLLHLSLLPPSPPRSLGAPRQPLPPMAVLPAHPGRLLLRRHSSDSAGMPAAWPAA